MDPVRVFVGTDRTQILAVKVLEHSIKRHTTLPVEVIPMCDLPIRPPKDPREGQRTGFSFSRFCIPAMAGYKGRAIYMDADMLVLKDIRELWEMDFRGAKVIIQEELDEKQSVTAKKAGAPKKRIKQCAVMLMDCSRLDWKIEDIIQGIDEGKYNYEKLMYDLCLLEESEIHYDLPFRWNSLEHLDDSTCLIHYTDMFTQPWVYPFNKNAGVWYDEVRLMLKNGSLTESEILEEIKMGHFRPSLMNDVKTLYSAPRLLKPVIEKWNRWSDNARGFKAHQAVYKAKQSRQEAIDAFERAGKTENRSST